MVELQPWSMKDFTLIEECGVEYPPGKVMESNDWRLDLLQGSGLDQS